MDDDVFEKAWLRKVGLLLASWSQQRFMRFSRSSRPSVWPQSISVTSGLSPRGIRNRTRLDTAPGRDTRLKTLGQMGMKERLMGAYRRTAPFQWWWTTAGHHNCRSNHSENTDYHIYFTLSLIKNKKKPSVSVTALEDVVLFQPIRNTLSACQSLYLTFEWLSCLWWAGFRGGWRKQSCNLDSLKLH